jgi:tripartite-type tricarboxylate transporter receptor subunit TctC
MAAELFRYVAKVDLNHIAYRGSSPAMVDLIGGQIQVMFENIASSLPYVNAKRVRPLGVTSPQRHPSFPELPAIAEAGVPGYSAVPYYTISASAKVPRDIISRINADLSAAIRSPELAPRWAEVGVTPLGGSLESAVQRNVAETEKWTRVIKSANIRAE